MPEVGDIVRAGCKNGFYGRVLDVEGDGKVTVRVVVHGNTTVQMTHMGDLTYAIPLGCYTLATGDALCDIGVARLHGRRFPFFQDEMGIRT